uniref:Acyl-coenzyme A thioesterase 13-like n=1 Tax=Nelumbo nucifera TaxID=4432 RepID=A0A822XES3_NELNU|nr:TPA_asm: hypothetical protein HUJ06_020293 [Nelumbo nucifera]
MPEEKQPLSLSPPSSLEHHRQGGEGQEGDISLSSSIDAVLRFFKNVGISEDVPEGAQINDYLSHLIRSFLKVDRIERGRITCILTPSPPLLNYYGSLHGGVVACVAELIAIACARTVSAPENKELFLGELATSYLSTAGRNVSPSLPNLGSFYF